MSAARDFKDFVLKGNVFDLAVGVIIGAAFGKIVDALVKFMIMPVVSLFSGKIDFRSLFVSLDGKSYPTIQDAQAVNAPILQYGMFIQSVIDFLIIALIIFIMVRVAARFRSATRAVPTREEELLGEIRDAIRSKT